MCGTCAWDTAIETANEIVEMAEEISELDGGGEFAQSVTERTTSIRAWVTEHEHATEKQINALDNMHRGSEKWLQD